MAKRRIDSPEKNIKRIEANGDWVEIKITMSYEQFTTTVINGRQNLSAGQEKVMPAFGLVEDVATYIDDIYAYLQARSDGVLGRGRPEKQ
mgnify:CR=1 FL=1